MAGRFHSETVTTTSANFDLIEYFRTKFGNQFITIEKLTLTSAVDIGLNINNLKDANGDLEFSKLRQDENAEYKLTLAENDVVITDLIIEDDATAVWVGMIF